MKAKRLLVRKARGLCPRIPPTYLWHGETEVLLLKVNDKREVVERQLFTARQVAGGPTIHGFTHYVILPKYV